MLPDSSSIGLWYIFFILRSEYDHKMVDEYAVTVATVGAVHILFT